MSILTREKLEQASRLVAQSEHDVWLIFVRETFNGGETMLPLITDSGLVWLSAFLISRTGERVAVVGNYDAEPFEHSGDWHRVVPYVQGIRDALVSTLEELTPPGRANIGVNYSLGNDKADGLSHGLYLLLEQYLEGTRFKGCLTSAEKLGTLFRSQKTGEEVRRMRVAIQETDKLFDLIGGMARPGVSEASIQRRVHQEIESRGHRYAWQKGGNPIVNSGPNSMIGHGIPSDSILLEAGHVFHVDLGIVVQDYSSDIQRCWYVARPDETHLPADVEQALRAVCGALDAGAHALKPGVQGWEVDFAARNYLVSQGYDEYLHALGHQVGRVAHDGGAVLAPRWERYGKMPFVPVQAGEVYTLELGVILPERGYLGLEEMVRVTDSELEWLTNRQLEIPIIR
jgi:Xaa-Pro dipeptidase